MLLRYIPGSSVAYLDGELRRATSAIVGALAACAAHISATLLEFCTVDNATMTKDMHIIPQIG